MAAILENYYNRIKPIYELKNHYPNEVSHTKYLDMFIDKRLTWSKHVDYITLKGANQILIFLQRNLINFHVQYKLKINCYRTFVCPIFDNCSTVWSLYTLCNINRTEAVQKHTTRFVFNAFSHCFSVTSIYASSRTIMANHGEVQIFTQTVNVL